MNQSNISNDDVMLTLRRKKKKCTAETKPPSHADEVWDHLVHLSKLIQSKTISYLLPWRKQLSAFL